MQELPHYHLGRGESEVFKVWSQEFLATETRNPIVGAWKRTLFTGKWEHTTDEDEITFNVQTSTLFIDLRIPRSKPVSRWASIGKQLIQNNEATSRQILESFSDRELRIYARQHVFGGFSKLQKENDRPLCTRHHCIDWNYIPNRPRPRPNKWYIEGDNKQEDDPFNAWVEWSYATDENRQSYYWERWERLSGDELGNGLRVALRKKKNADDVAESHVDGILVVVGDHFNYIIARDVPSHVKEYGNANNLVELVDSAIADGDREAAISYLSLDGGHGTVSSGWLVDCSIQPWNHGKQLVNCIHGGQDTEIKVIGNGSDFCNWEVIFGKSAWDVYECSLQRASDLELILKQPTPMSSRL